MNEKELRQLQTALKGTEGVTLARKAPRQLGLFVDFKGHQYRVDYLLNIGWRVTRGYGELPNATELATLIPIVLKAEQDKEMEAIVETKAAKAKAEEDRKTAIAQAEAEKKKTEELRDYCRLTVTPGFDRQSWCENHFGIGKWHISELNRQELEILSAEIKQRVGDGVEEAIAPTLGVKETECPECEGSGMCQGELQALNAGQKECPCWEESGITSGGESLGEGCPNDGICPSCEGSGWVEVECMDEKEAIASVPDCEEMVAALNQIFEEDWKVFAAIISNDFISVMFNDTEENFLISQELGSWQFLAASTPQSLSPRAEIVREALKQALEIFGEKQGKEAITQNSCMDENSSIEEKAITLKGKALTLKQPWAWAVFALGKNVENRSWDTAYRGQLFIHAGQTYDHSGAAWIAQKFGVEVPGPGNLPSGAIVGWVEIGSVSQESFKPNLFPWAIEGQYHWHLKRPYQFHEPIPYQGRLGLWPVEIPFPAPPQWILDNAQEFWARGREIPNGSPYCPSNGSEGDWFCGGWCEQCSRLNSCPLPIRSMGGDQPPEWVYWNQKPICLAWDEAIADKPLAYYLYQGLYKVGDSEGNLEEFESAEEAIEFINNWGSTVTAIAAQAKTGKSLAFYQIAEEVTR